MLADKEGDIFAIEKVEGGRQTLPERFKGFDRPAITQKSAKPIFARSVFAQPRIR